MILNNILYTLIFLVFSYCSFAQNEKVSVEDRAQRIVEVMNKEHLQPIEITSEKSSKYIFDAFLDFVDPNYLVFSKEDIEDWSSHKISIGEEINNKNISFYESVKSQLETRSKQLVSSVNSISIKDIENSNFALSDGYVSQSELNNQLVSFMKFKVNIEFLGRIDVASDYDKSVIQNQLDSSFRIVKSAMIDYFSDLVEEESFESSYLNAITTCYDPHSNYFSASMNSAFSQELSRERELFGISYEKDLKGKIHITNIVPGSDAWLNGNVHVGDEIVSFKFGDKSPIKIEGYSINKISKLFDENDDKNLILELKNKETIKLVELHKSKVYSNDDILKYGILKGEKNIAYISLPDFYLNWTDTTQLGCANDVAKAILKMKREGIDGVILDLRNNGGGSVQEAIDLIGIFLNYGPVIIRKSTGDNIYSLKDRNKGAIYMGPLIVMVNESSASASELVSDAIQKHNLGIVVGRQTYGKATGQYVKELDPSNSGDENWGYLKITTMGLYSINLTNYQKQGVNPDIIIPSASEDEWKESDYITAIDFDSIQKKVYYTPRPKKNIEVAKQSSESRMNESRELKTLVAINNEIDSLLLKSDLSVMNAADAILFSKELDQLRDKYSEVEHLTEKFKLQNIDEEVTNLSEYMVRYQEDFERRVLEDFELEEAYTIIIDLINNK